MVQPQPGAPWWVRARRAYGIDDAREYGTPVWLLTAGQGIAAVGRGVAVPFIVIYLTRVVGIPLTVVGLGVLVEHLVSAVTGPAAGWASDRWGRKPVMLAGLVATAVAVPGYVLVADATGFIVLSAFVGVARSIYGPASSGYIADVTSPRHRAGAFGLVHVSRNLGWAVGIAVGAVITAATPSFVPLFLIGGVAPFLFAVFIAVVIREPARAAPPARANPFRDVGRLVGHAPFAIYLALASGCFLLWGVFNNLLPLYVVDGMYLPATAVAGPFAVNPVLIVLLQLPFGALGDRIDRFRGIAVACVFGGLAYAVLAGGGGLRLAGVHPMATLVAASVLLTVSELLFTPLLSATASELAPPDLRGSAAGFLGLASAVGQGGAPILAGVVVTAYGWSWFWTAVCAWTVLCGLGLLVARRRLAAACAENERPATVA